jgi:hypothetical protein
VTRRVYRTISGDRVPRDLRANAVTIASRPAPSEAAKIVAGRGWPSHGALPKQRRGHNRWTASGRIRTGDGSACADANYSIRGSKLHAETHRVKARHEAGDGCQHQRVIISGSWYCFSRFSGAVAAARSHYGLCRGLARRQSWRLANLPMRSEATLHRTRKHWIVEVLVLRLQSLLSFEHGQGGHC